MAMEAPQEQDTDAINQSVDVLSVSILVICLVVPTITGRLYVRTRLIPYFGIDDVFMLLSGISVVSVAVYSGIVVTEGNYGTGQHLDEVDTRELINFDKSVYIWELGYTIAQFFIKMSILTYYNRLQSSILYKTTMVVVAAGSLSFLITNIFQCNPVDAAWDPNASPNGNKSQQCINDVAFTYASATFNIITDFWIWGCCITMLKGGLQVGKRKKIEVIVIFSLGLLACGASIGRICTISRFYATIDKTWAIVPIMTCSFLELALAIVAACLPTLKPGFNTLSSWIKQQSAYIRASRLFSKIPTIKIKSSSSSSRGGGHKSSCFSITGKPEMNVRTATPVTRDMSTIRSMIEASEGRGENNTNPILAEIGRWGLQNNDFCQDLEMQHELPTAAVPRSGVRSLSKHYLGNERT
ncbi:hypothetical protein AA313_de0207007 [Arthrobotrys entomopaga]|nr:hypothetical protein AA313_de0207007 [Arthrobotrys entomopaga]